MIFENHSMISSHGKCEECSKEIYYIRWYHGSPYAEIVCFACETICGVYMLDGIITQIEMEKPNEHN